MSVKTQLFVGAHDVKIGRGATIACATSAMSTTTKAKVALVSICSLHKGIKPNAHVLIRTDRGAASASVGIDAAVLWGQERNAKIFGEIFHK